MLPHEKEHERQAFREMSFGKKLEHFKTYYALPVGIVAAILILGIVLISRIFFHPEETHIFSAAVFEEYFDDDAKAAFTEKIKTISSLLLLSTINSSIQKNSQILLHINM